MPSASFAYAADYCIVQIALACALIRLAADF